MSALCSLSAEVGFNEFQDILAAGLIICETVTLIIYSGISNQNRNYVGRWRMDERVILDTACTVLRLHVDSQCAVTM